MAASYDTINLEELIAELTYNMPTTDVTFSSLREARQYSDKILRILTLKTRVLKGASTSRKEWYRTFESIIQKYENDNLLNVCWCCFKDIIDLNDMVSPKCCENKFTCLDCATYIFKAVIDNKTRTAKRISEPRCHTCGKDYYNGSRQFILPDDSYKESVRRYYVTMWDIYMAFKSLEKSSRKKRFFKMAEWRLKLHNAEQEYRLSQPLLEKYTLVYKSKGDLSSLIILDYNTNTSQGQDEKKKTKTRVMTRITTRRLLPP